MCNIELELLCPLMVERPYMLEHIQHSTDELRVLGPDSI